MKSYGYHYANDVKAELEVPLNEARALASVFESMVNTKEIQQTREEVNTILKYFIENNDNFLGVYVLFEPDAFDSSDLKYKNTFGSDETGRFIPYWTRGTDGKGVVEALLEYEIQGDGDYYQIPKRTNNEAILDPYLYPIQGVETLLTSLVVPIKNENGQFIGIAGLDVSLQDLQVLASGISINGFPDAYLKFYSNRGIVVASQDEKFIGGSVEDSTNSQELIKSVNNNESFNITRHSNTLDTNVISTGITVEIGDTKSKWLVEVNLSEETLMIKATQLINTIIIGLIAMLIIVIVVYILFGAQINSPFSTLLNSPFAYTGFHTI